MSLVVHTTETTPESQNTPEMPMHPRLSLKLKPPPDDLSNQTHPTTAGKTIESLLHVLGNPAPQSPSTLSGYSESSEHLQPGQRPPVTSADINQPPTTDTHAKLAKWLENSPSKKLCMATTPTPSPEDTMTMGHTSKKKSSNPEMLYPAAVLVTGIYQAKQENMFRSCCRTWISR